MLLREYFMKHLSGGEHTKGGPDGFFVSELNVIKEISHGTRARGENYPLVPGNKGKLPEDYVVIENGICPPWGNNIVSEATARKASVLIEKAKELHRQITELLENEPEPPPPAKLSRPVR